MPPSLITVAATETMHSLNVTDTANVQQVWLNIARWSGHGMPTRPTKLSQGSPRWTSRDTASDRKVDRGGAAMRGASSAPSIVMRDPLAAGAA